MRSTLKSLVLGAIIGIGAMTASAMAFDNSGSTSTMYDPIGTGSMTAPADVIATNYCPIDNVLFGINEEALGAFLVAGDSDSGGYIDKIASTGWGVAPADLSLLEDTQAGLIETLIAMPCGGSPNVNLGALDDDIRTAFETS